MNAVEGFFAVGAIIGPMIVTYLLSKSVRWQWLYVIAGSLCVLLIIMASVVRYPETKKSTQEKINLSRTFSMLKDPYALGFSIGAFLYVAVECAVYVWMPTLIEQYEGRLILIATYSLSSFYTQDWAVHGVWLLQFNWLTILCVFCFLIFCASGQCHRRHRCSCHTTALSGLFMSLSIPLLTERYKLFPQVQHGSVAVFYSSLPQPVPL